MRKLNKQLFKLLRLHSPSGNERSVIRYVFPILKVTLDKVWIDSYGNVLGEKKYGDSPTEVLLSAHMDTVAGVQPHPKYRKNKTEIYNEHQLSALGGDDKCGIAAILAIIREMNRHTRFTGTLKVCLSREEEVGCVGAEEAVRINPEFFKTIDAAIVLDRRGNKDIVTGMGYAKFCSEEYGEFWEDMAQKVGFTALTTKGSISDTMVFSELGINGVNLSVGYYNAHMPTEYIRLQDLQRTICWVLKAFDHIEKYIPFPSFEYEKYSGDDSWFYNSDVQLVTCENCLLDVDVTETYMYREYTLCLNCMDSLLEEGELESEEVR